MDSLLRVSSDTADREEAAVPDAADPEKVARLRSDDLTWTSTDQGVTVLDMLTARYLQLNRSGALLWELLSDGASEDELVAALRERFGIDEERARTDVGAFLAALRERDFLA